jgi:hypothetical protein
MDKRELYIKSLQNKITESIIYYKALIQNDVHADDYLTKERCNMIENMREWYNDLVEMEGL